METDIKKYIDILVEFEPIIKEAGKLSLKLRSTTKTHNKLQTGIEGVDIVTEADCAVQEFILSKLTKTELVNCKIIAEEDTPSVTKFKGTNGLTLTIDPIDGTIFYANGKRFFCIIICLRNEKEMLYTFCHYPVVNWSRRVADGSVVDFGELPEVKTKDGLDLSKIITHTFAEPEKNIPEVYLKLVLEGYIFKKVSEITDESSSHTLLYLNQTAGYFTNNPGAYDGLCALLYGQVKKFKIYSGIDIAKVADGTRGKYCPGWYLVLRK